ncbi:trigger factor [Clostridium akagii]|uniref:trigger factor n=1 Tax=Clostridium akagii TaxID=91623 RepID=UPI00047ED18C|nr:trigger factor [Clostridium akagii]
MNAKLEKLENNVVKFEITVESAKFNEAVKKAYKKNSKKYDVPGFRKGKAPLSIIEQYFGAGVFYEDAVNFCCDDTYPAALEENNIKPVDYPEIDIVEIGEGKDLVYTAKVTVVPEVELGEYKGVEVKTVKYPVTEEDIDNELKAMQQKNARIETKEAESVVENTNIAVIDFKGFIDGTPFEGGEGTDYSLEIGSGAFIGNFEEQLIGLKKGDTKDVEVSFPEEYGKEEFNGKKALFNVTIKEIKVKELPALDDEFAKDVSEFDTLEELRNDSKSKFEETNSKKEKDEYEDAVISAVCDNAKVDVPEVMIKSEVDQMVKELESKLSYQGLDLKSYYEFTNSSEEKVREFMGETAEKRVKTRLVLEEIVKKEDIKVTEEELLVKATELAKQYSEKDDEKMAKMLLDAQRNILEHDVANEKVIDLLVNSSKTVE